MKYHAYKLDNTYDAFFDTLEEAKQDISLQTCDGLLFKQEDLFETPCGCQFKIERIHEDGKIDDIML